MNNSIKFTQSETRTALWSSDLFKIDHNVQISISIFRSKKNEGKNINHIWKFEALICGSSLEINSDKNQINTKLISKIENEFKNSKLSIIKDQKQLYLVIINLIILQTLLFDFNDINEIDVDLTYIKKIYDDYFNNKINRNYQNIIDDDKFRSYIVRNKDKILNIIDDGDEFLSYIVRNKDKILKINCEVLKQMIREYKEKLEDDNLKESDWQIFFNDNKFIISLILPTPIILDEDQAQCNYTNFNLKKYKKIADYIYKNKLTKNCCLVEIKTPKTQLFCEGTYRKGIYKMSSDLIGGLNQLINYKEIFSKHYKSNDNDKNNWWNIKIVLIIGSIK